MNFDFGEVLSRAWQITWKYKVLWIIGILLGFLIAMLFPLMFIPAFLPELMQNSSTDLMPVLIMGGTIFILIIFMLVLYPASVLTHTSLTLGVLNANQDGEYLSASELIKRSFPFFWRVLGLLLLFAAGTMLITFIFQAIIFFLMIVTLGLATICIMPLSLLMYPALYLAIVWMEQSMNAIIIDNMPVMDAARQGWNLVRNNLLPLALMALVIYFGIGLITGIVIVPMMIPFFLMPFSLMEQQTNWTVLSISIVCIAISIPLFAILTGWSMVFTKSAWVLTYLRLTRSSNVQLKIQKVSS